MHLKLNLVDHVHGRIRFEDMSIDPPDDRKLTPQMDLPEKQWRDMGMPVEISVFVVKGHYKDPAELFAAVQEEVVSG